MAKAKLKEKEDVEKKKTELDEVEEGLEILRFADEQESHDVFFYMKMQGFLYDEHTDTIVPAK